MLDIIFKQKNLKLLCLGAHSDDIEIGCGGTVLKLIDNYQIDFVRWIVFSSVEERKTEAHSSADIFLNKVSKKNITIGNYRDGFLPYVGYEVKDFFEELKKDFTPDIIFTHYRHDLHQDHRLICELTWNTFREHFILEYEIPKYDGDFGAPNFYVHLDKDLIDKKINAILSSFTSQSGKHWFDKETFSSVMRIRGMESASQTGYAEAFYSRKLVFNR
jgi:LmbE family N-acetylglucosaminyl deacetylase